MSSDSSKHTDFKDSIKKFPKAFTKKFLVGIIALMGIGGFGIIGSFFHMSSSIQSGAYYGNQLSGSATIWGILWMLFSFIYLVGIILFSSFLYRRINMMKQVQKELPTDQNKIVSKNLHFIPLVFAGGVIATILYVMFGFFWALTGHDMSDPRSLFGAFQSHSWYVILIQVVSIAIMGVLVPKFESLYLSFHKTIEDKIPPEVKKYLKFFS